MCQLGGQRKIMKKAKRRKKNYILWCFLGLVTSGLIVLLNTLNQNDTYQKVVYEEETKMLYKEITEGEILEIQQQKSKGRQNIKSSILTEEDEKNIFKLGKIVAAEGGGVDSRECQAQAIEAGITSDKWQQYIAYVVLNRVYQQNYPNTIEEVFYQKGQYAPTSIERYEAGFITDNALKNAEIAYLNYLYDEMEVPKNMVFQSEFEQGEVFIHVGNTFFGTSPKLPSH